MPSHSGSVYANAHRTMNAFPVASRDRREAPNSEQEKATSSHPDRCDKLSLPPNATTDNGDYRCGAS